MLINYLLSGGSGVVQRTTTSKLFKSSLNNALDRYRAFNNRACSDRITIYVADQNMKYNALRRPNYVDIVNISAFIHRIDINNILDLIISLIDKMKQFDTNLQYNIIATAIDDES